MSTTAARTDETFDAAGWWRAVRPALLPLGEPEPSLTAAALETTLRDSLSPELARRLELPSALRAALDVAGPHAWLSQRICRDFILLPARGVLTATRSALARFADPGPDAAGLWLELGSRGDRERLFVCCDRADPSFGCVSAAEDQHPWCDESALLAEDQPLADFYWDLTTGWRRRFAARLVQVSVDEAAAVRSGDLLAGLTTALELADGLTPDPAWRSTCRAPDRVLVLTEAPASLPQPALLRHEDISVHLLPPRALVGALQPAAWGVASWDAEAGQLRPKRDALTVVWAFLARVERQRGYVMVVVE